jgi:quercetin dioxygenase-like cupin family protein
MDLNFYAFGKNEGPAVWFLDTLTFVKATAQQTGTAFGLVEQLAPVGIASPYHVHGNEDEAFYVVEGELEFISGERRWTGGPGSYVFLPRDIPHGFRVVGKSPARFLVLITPGGFEHFVMEVGQPASTLTLPVPEAPDMDKLIKVAAKYRIEILGPLPE